MALDCHETSSLEALLLTLMRDVSNYLIILDYINNNRRKLYPFLTAETNYARRSLQ